MGPRKKPRQNSKAAVEDRRSETEQASDSAQQSASSSHIDDSTASITESNASEIGKTAGASGEPISQPPTRNKSWYGGSWKAKASPIARVAKESIGFDRGSTKELGDGSPKQGLINSSPTKFLSKRRSSKADPLAASMTKLHVTSNNGSDQNSESAVEGGDNASIPAAPLPPDPLKIDAESEDQVEANGTPTSSKGDQKKQDYTSSWRIWWSRPDGYQNESSKLQGSSKEEQEISEAQNTPLPATSPSEDRQNQAKTLDSTTKQTNDNNTAEGNKDPALTIIEKASQRTSWFWLWSNSQNNQNQSPVASDSIKTTKGTDQPTQEVDIEPIPQSQEISAQTETNSSKPVPKSTGWAFWSREQPRTQGEQSAGQAHKEIGEIAVADTPSQSHPEPAQCNEEGDQKKSDSTKSVSGSFRGKDKSAKPTAQIKSNLSQMTLPNSIEDNLAKQSQVLSPRVQSPNLILPEFRNTYQPAYSASYWQQIRQYFLGGEKETPRLHITSSPPRVKKAIAIGIHGFFPSPLIQKFIGQPTGTSIRFANHAATAISDWTQAHGYTCEIEKVALEGEGFIKDRVDMLWKLLLNWIDHIRKADFILIACHSQGVPVATMLVAKLIQFGCVNATRMGICAMAGINLGPFPEYKTRLFGGTATELFEFTKPNSAVSLTYRTALEEVLKYGVKLLYIGSIDDQLVSLESSTFSSISHPYIYRAVFVDSRTHAPDL